MLLARQGDPCFCRQREDLLTVLDDPKFPLGWALTRVPSRTGMMLDTIVNLHPADRINSR
jgi:hypothetical protein